MISLFDAVGLLCSGLPAVVAATLLISLVAALRYRARALWIIAAVTLLVSGCAGVLQVQVQLRPAFDVLYLQPDRVLGWKQVPNLRWTWAGFARYVDEFNVDIQTNSHGFRDLERRFEKEDGVVRIALLGASMIEAVQVPLEQTAGQVLEKRLNAEPPPLRADARRFEVLNFGVSAYGIGQTLLVWEAYAHRFEPDYVFLYLSPLSLELTVETHQAPRFTGAKKKLQVRPGFRIDAGKLVRSPPLHTAAFIKGQQRLMREVYGGTRTRRRYFSVALKCYLVMQSFDFALPGRTCDGDVPDVTPPAKRYSVSDSEVREVNLAIIRELAHKVETAGARFVLVDDTAEHSLGSANLRAVMQALSDELAVGYIPLYAALAEAQVRDVPTHWKRDIHFNRAGNELLGNSMHRWMAEAESQRR